MFTSQDWIECSLSSKSEGKEIKRIVVRDERFWRSVSYSLKTIEPLVKVLRLADSEKMSGMRFIYGAMDSAKEEIANNLGNDMASYKEIWDIIDEKWEFQLHRDLHAAAYFLNPRFQYSSNISNHPEIRIGFSNCMMKLIPNREDQHKAMVQEQNFKKRIGLFGFGHARDAVNILAPGILHSNFFKLFQSFCCDYNL